MLRVQESALAGLKGKSGRGLENTSGLCLSVCVCTHLCK